ncbi:hypothetical protein HY496_00015 [Candidatus Woesearchaeota archaeon]|nr:hypothetical protein [Candidatus Woesearchaeota archaeon]
MLDELRQLDRERELRKPENRMILRAYETAEMERLDKAVYSSLEKKYPSLSGCLEAIRKETDPVEAMEKARSELRMVGIAKAFLGALALNDDEDTQTINAMVNKIDPAVRLYRQYAPLQEHFYVDLARAVKEVSTRREVGIEETVRNVQYVNEVFKIATPTREEAESFLRVSQTYGREMLDIGRGFIALARKTGHASEDVLEKAKLLPTTEAMEAMQKGIWDYKMHEFDRIYSV